MKAKSIKGKSTEEIQSALKQSMADGFKPTLAICFISKNQDRVAITALLDSYGIAVFSCAGRILSPGPLMSKELEGVKNIWNVPMAGMFSNAELGRATGGNLEMHNLTTCCVALKEK